MNKILNVLFGILMLVSLTASLVNAQDPGIMPRHDPDQLQGVIVSDPNPIAIVGQTVSDSDPEYHVTVIARNSQIPRDFKGSFYLEIYDALAPINGVLTTTNSDVTIIYVPAAGFSADGMTVIGDATIVSQYNDRVEILLSGDAAVMAGYTDIENPTVTIDPSTPTVLGSLYGAPTNFNIKVNAADNDAVQNVKVDIDGNTVYLAETSPGVWEGVTSVIMGGHNYIVTATDWQGNTATANGYVTLYGYAPIQTEPPVITGLVNQTVTAGSNNQAIVTITADITDDQGIASVALNINNANYNITLLNGSTYGATVTLAPGQYSVLIGAVDDQGQVTFAGAIITVNPYVAPSNNGGNTGSNGGSSSSSNHRNGGFRGVTGTVPQRNTNGGIVEQPKPVEQPQVAVPEPVQAPAEVVAPAPKQSFWQWSIFKTAAFNVLLLALILLAMLVFR